MIENFLDLVLLSLASFRLTRLIVFDKITSFLRKPFFEEVVEKNAQGETEVYIVPKKSGLKGWIGELLSCYWCTGVWITMFIVLISYLIPYWSNPIIVVLAVAGLASLFETVVQFFIRE
ncbi:MULTISPECIES: DUF1360 domain-containing protein [Bacillus]|uniref:DUF1360 domain-containing protein n=1 Tax=Bacillus TaxID=1386 RepID=UPI00031E7A19|nr:MULTISPECIES: DUF1360 domain-containing protein [Bacillus]